MKVYILTAGEYSSYHIVAVYSTEQLAKDYAVAAGLDPDAVVTTELDDPDYIHQHSDLFGYHIKMWYEGNIEYARCGERKAKHTVAPSVSFDVNHKNIFEASFFIQAPNRDTAIKIAADMRAGLIKENRWRRVKLEMCMPIDYAGQALHMESYFGSDIGDPPLSSSYYEPKFSNRILASLGYWLRNFHPTLMLEEMHITEIGDVSIILCYKPVVEEGNG